MAVEYDYIHSFLDSRDNPMQSWNLHKVFNTYCGFLLSVSEQQCIHGIVTDLLIPEYSSQPRQTMSVWFEKQNSLFHRLYLRLQQAW